MDKFSMDKQNGILLFNSLHPAFFEREDIRNMPEEWVCEEMILSLDEFDPHRYEKTLDGDISFGYYQGKLEELKKKIERVNIHWGALFHETDRVYCGYAGGEVVSFCIVEDMGVHYLSGSKWKIGGPGCVGTLPEYRDRGIGLTMVSQVTQILKDEGYDYSYIHYTGVAPWYEKLGYKTFLKWSKSGILQ